MSDNVFGKPYIEKDLTNASRNTKAWNVRLKVAITLIDYGLIVWGLLIEKLCISLQCRVRHIVGQATHRSFLH